MSSLPVAFLKYIAQLLLCVYFVYCGVVAAEKEPSELEPDMIMEESKNIVPIDGNDSSTKKVGFFPAFVASFSVIIVSELGDKTFFIAAIMAMRYPRLTVFGGAITALILMTILSVGFGWFATYIPRSYTYYVSTALFAIFGLKMLRDGYYMSPNEGKEEYDEVQSDIRKREDELEKNKMLSTDLESGETIRSNNRCKILNYIPEVFLQSFSLTFFAEWGDRSQFTTILLAAREDVFGVSLGGVVGHSMCTGLAVIGGRMIAQKISVRTVTLIGGVVFLVFAVTALFTYPKDLS
ncbi:transmembrane protein TPARL, putative [Pediculus humanus corporis]|uniref:GDT1 family protein n=1 Tax=Pediculus humanus subsp. corporis TaxID=121224 RepID=E0V9C2_PEDHC|nr:transmembrane protein TPARL, putative [Pediculus humanus corporis]EEB09978.1 transmembrane protein TPARL, putative [Pediculus humanus corporis]